MSKSKRISTSAKPSSRQDAGERESMDKGQHTGKKKCLSKIDTPNRHAKGLWYATGNSELSTEEAEKPHSVYKTPINFFYLDSPFDLHAVQAEDVDHWGCDGVYHARTVVIDKPVPLKQVAKISVREGKKANRGADTRGNVAICGGNTCKPGEFEKVISLQDNAMASGEHAVAIALGEHAGVACCGKYSNAIAAQHGSNAAASGLRSNAVTLQDGWAIAGDGHAVAVSNGKAVSCGSHGMAVVCDLPGEAYAFGRYGHAVACSDSSEATASGKLGVAVALGDDSKATCNDAHGLAIATGQGGQARGAIGCWLLFVQRNKRDYPVKIVAAQVDGETILPDTWYTVVKGNIVAV